MAIFTYKIKNNLLPKIVIDLFTCPNHKYNLIIRNTDFSINTFNTVKYGKNSLRYFGPHLWSKLNSSIRLEPCFSVFKNKIRKLDLLKHST